MSVDTSFFGGSTFQVDGVEFVSGYGASTGERFCILKTEAQIEFYRDLCEQVRGGALVELGIAAGGSAALLTLLATPRRLVALELNEARVDALDTLIDARGVADRVHPMYGVNQADRERLVQIVRDEFGDDPLDLVVDDASHLLPETTASFETLFPSLRPGGLYVIEDWNSWHLFADQVGSAEKDGTAFPTPLSPLIMELLLIRAASGDIVEEIRVGDLWATIRRGPAPLDPRTFRVRDHYVDHFGLLDSARGG